MNKTDLIIIENFIDTPRELLSYIRNNVEWDERMKAR